MEKQVRVDAAVLAAVQNHYAFRSDSAANTTFFAQQLTHIMSRTFDRKYPNFSAMGLIPVSTEGGPGAETIKYYSFDKVGVAKVIANYADDLPNVSVNGKEFIGNIKGIGDSYDYSIQDLRAAQMAGTPLTERKGAAARRAIEAKVNNIAFYGDETYGLVGLLTHPNIPEFVLPNDGTGGSVRLQSKTPDSILRDLNGMANEIVNVTNGVEMPSVLAIDNELYSYLATTRIPDTTTTILKFFLENTPYIKRVVPVPEFSEANGGDNVMIMGAFDPDHIELRIPQPFEQFPPEARNMSFVVNCHTRCGGVAIYYPFAFIKAYNRD